MYEFLKCEILKTFWVKKSEKVVDRLTFSNIQFFEWKICHNPILIFPEAVFLVVCDPSMNEQWVT